MRRLMYAMSISIAVLSGALFSPPSGAQELWHGAQYGMSTAQVLRVVPDAHAVHSDAQIKARGGWADELLRVEGIDLVTEKFDAHFYFLAGRLQQVTLSQVGLKGYGADIAYQNLVTALRAKYGRETASKEKGGFMTTKSTDWIHGRTNINLLLMYSNSDENSPVLNINYQVRLAEDAEKL